MKKRELQPLIESVTAKADKLKLPGSNTKVNQMDFVLEMAKVAGLDNDDSEVKRLKGIWGEQLRTRREDYNLSLREVGRAALMNHKTIAAVERGDAHIARYPFVHFMLEVCISKLTTESEQEKEKAGTLQSISKRKSNIPA